MNFENMTNEQWVRYTKHFMMQEGNNFYECLYHPRYQQLLYLNEFKLGIDRYGRIVILGRRR